MCAGNSINVKIIVYKWGIKIKVPTGLFDFCFFVYIVTELAFSHTLIGRIGLVLFVISVALLCLMLKPFHPVKNLPELPVLR